MKLNDTDTVKKTIITRHLRNYYNECLTVLYEVDNEEITTQESEDALIELDDKYAELILGEL